jgi:hypothetical protein
LINDENVDIIFEYKSNLVLDKGLDYLAKFENEQLYVTAAVIVANFMRNDASVLKIIKDAREPHVKILNILSQYNRLETDPTLQQINVTHSLLGALRNFCVAKSAQEDILKHDCIRIVLPYLSNETLDIKCKALSIFRLLIKNCTEKTGLDLVFDAKTLEILQLLAETPSQHMGVNGEASRLICYMPIAAKTEKRVKDFCRFKLISMITNQLKSEYLIMLNEALLALNVLVTIDYSVSCAQLKSAKLSEHLKGVIQRKQLPIEMCLNSMRLFKFLLDKNDFFTQDELKEHFEAFKQAKLSADTDFLKTNLTQLIDLVENLIEN